MTAGQSPHQHADFLAGLANIDPSVARDVLHRFNNNVEAATDFLLSGGDPNDPPAYSFGTTNTQSTDGMPALVPSEPDDRAGIQQSQSSNMSVDLKQPVPQYNPDSWALVPANTDNTTSLDEAIALSLQDAQEEEMLPQDLPLRQPDCTSPVALWPQRTGQVYIALVLHSLFHIPQVKAAISQLRLSPESESYDILFKTQQLFAAMDLTVLPVIQDNNDSFNVFPAQRLEPNEAPGHKSKDLLASLGMLIERELPDETQRLMTFAHATVIQRLISPTNNDFNIVKKNPALGCVVLLPRTSASNSPELDPHNLDVKTNSMMVGLLNRLTTFFDDERIEHDVIREPSDVIGFQIENPVDEPIPLDKLQRFTYPTRFYLDPFLLENFEIAKDKRTERGKIIAEISRLLRQKARLAAFVESTLPSLRTCIHYFEHIADSSAHKANKQGVAQKLHTAYSHVEKAVADTEARLNALRDQAANIFNEPQFQRHPYDLRAVLVHSSDFGRKQLYSYVHDEKNRWWKTVGHSVTEVPESEVLEDDTGLRQGAGTYLLLYSKALSPQEVGYPVTWPFDIQAGIDENNRHALMVNQPIKPPYSEPPPPQVHPIAQQGNPTTSNVPSSPRRLPNPRAT